MADTAGERLAIDPRQSRDVLQSVLAVFGDINQCQTLKQALAKH